MYSHNAPLELLNLVSSKRVVINGLHQNLRMDKLFALAIALLPGPVQAPMVVQRQGLRPQTLDVTPMR